MAAPGQAATFARDNQVDYIGQCVDSMTRHGMNLERLVAVNNGSRHGTRDFLAGLPLGGRNSNAAILGCGMARNDTALA